MKILKNTTEKGILQKNDLRKWIDTLQDKKLIEKVLSDLREGKAPGLVGINTAIARHLYDSLSDEILQTYKCLKYPVSPKILRLKFLLLGKILEKNVSEEILVCFETERNSVYIRNSKALGPMSTRKTVRKSTGNAQ